MMPELADDLLCGGEAKIEQARIVDRRDSCTNLSFLHV
jgi:hypothetical protein